MVLGEFNHGKSTFINALLGAPVLPTGITPTTAASTTGRGRDEPRATRHLVDDDGAQQDRPASALADWVTVDGGREASRRRTTSRWLTRRRCSRTS